MSGKLLIIEGHSGCGDQLKQRLEAAYFTVSTAETAEQFLSDRRATGVDIILIAHDAAQDGIAACRAIKSRARLALTPVVLMSDRDDRTERLDGFAAGADDFLTLPIGDAALLARLRALSRFRLMAEELRLRDATSMEFGLSAPASARHPGRGGAIGVVTAEEAEATRLASAIKETLGADVVWLPSGGAAMRRLRSAPPDAFLVTGRLPAAESCEALCSALTRHAVDAPPAVLAIAGETDADEAPRWLDHGASDVLLDPVDPEELAARLKVQLRKKFYSERLRTYVRDGLRQSVTDPLTGLYNRRYVDQHLALRVAKARDAGAPLTVLAFDIDNFKRVNDRFGHQIGDQALRVFAGRLRRNLRGVDLVARVGGEEFLVALPDVALRDGYAAAERIRRIAAEPAPGAPRITVSAGVAALAPGDLSPEALLSRADAALYRAKSEGRNCVMRQAAA